MEPVSDLDSVIQTMYADTSVAQEASKKIVQ